MPPPSFLKHTVDISVQLPAGTLSVDVAKYISEYFAGKYTVRSIQQCPGHVARIIFVKPEARSAVEELQRIELNGFLFWWLFRYCLRHVIRMFLFISIFSKVPINRLLIFFVISEVDSVHFQHWTNLPEVCTGTRIICMIRRNHIPRFVIINGYRCKVWYKGQPLKCDTCNGDHKAASCPHKSKCLWCGDEGHFACHCPNPWGKSVPPADPDVGLSSDLCDDSAPADVMPDPPAVDPSVVDPLAPYPVVVIIKEGSVSPVAGDSPPVVDSGSVPEIVMAERFNQLDELAS